MKGTTRILPTQFPNPLILLAGESAPYYRTFNIYSDYKSNFRSLKNDIIQNYIESEILFYSLSCLPVVTIGIICIIDTHTHTHTHKYTCAILLFITKLVSIFTQGM